MKGVATDEAPQNSDVSTSRLKALARWDNEGGAGPEGPQKHNLPDDVFDDGSPLADAELVQLRIRVIALENLMIALMADTSEANRDLARQMAGYILPRPGSTRHPLTIHAARQMLSMIERAEHLRVVDASARQARSGEYNGQN